MSLPVSVPYAFANATTTQNLSSLDANFNALANGLNGLANGASQISVSSISATGTANSTTYLRGDGAWANISGSGSDVTYANVTVTQNLVPPSSFLRNRIINGDMRIDQRNAGASQAIPTGTSTYCVDRWACYALGAGVTTQQVASGVTGVPYILQLTGAASNTSAQLLQRIESKNIADLAGSTVTLSALISNSLVTTITWYAYYANTADNFSAVTLISQGNFTVSSTLTSYAAQIALPSNAANGIQIVFVAPNQTSGTFKLGNVQLEVGSNATPFERRQYGTEFMLCQRYYEVCPFTAVPTLGVVFIYPANQYKVSKRAAATLTFNGVNNGQTFVDYQGNAGPVGQAFRQNTAASTQTDCTVFANAEL